MSNNYFLIFKFIFSALLINTDEVLCYVQIRLMMKSSRDVLWFVETESSQEE